jgi:hypothetical protein
MRKRNENRVVPKRKRKRRNKGKRENTGWREGREGFLEKGKRGQKRKDTG